MKILLGNDRFPCLESTAIRDKDWRGRAIRGRSGVGARKRGGGGTNQQFIRGSVTFSPRLIVMFAESWAPARGLPGNSSQRSFSARIRRRKRGGEVSKGRQQRNFIPHCRIICSLLGPFLKIGNLCKNRFRKVCKINLLLQRFYFSLIFDTRIRLHRGIKLIDWEKCD